MFHVINLGAFGGSLRTDMNGYVPEAADGPWDLAVDHGTKATHNPDGSLTDYGQWWEDEGFPEWRDEAIETTARKQNALAEWQQPNA